MKVIGRLLSAALFTAIPFSIQVSPTTRLPSVSLDTADARVGRPLTPFSVAGVHRRAYRRGYYGGGWAPGLGLGVGALAAGAIAAAPYYGNSGYGGYPSYGYSGYQSYPSYGYSGVRPYGGYRWRHW